VIGFPDEGEMSIQNIEKKTTHGFEFEKIFQPRSTQEEVFTEVSDLIISVLDGYNVCIFAYGQTGSGKTFTLEGDEQNRGVNFKALSELFSIKQKRGKDYVYKISVSMKEIYNETIRDLLATKESKENSEDELKIMTGDRGMYVKGLVLEPVQTEEEVLTLFKRGNSNRSVGRTNVNEHSSRSHSMLTVEVEGENLIAGIKYFGKLHLVDLAGSERLAKTMATGDRLKEAQAINKSLSALGNVIEALQKKNSHVPYRNSKLTYLLSDSLGGHAKTLMFINVSPNSTDADETNCSLIFATRVRKVELGTAVQAKSASGGETKEEGQEPEEGASEEKKEKAPPTAAGAKAKTPAPAAAAKPGAAKAAAPAAKPAAAAAKPAAKTPAGKKQ